MYCERRRSLSLHPSLSSGINLLCVRFPTSFKSNLCTFISDRTQTEQQYLFAPTRHNCISAKCIFKWNASVTGHKPILVWLPNLHHQCQGQSCSRKSTTVGTIRLMKLPHTLPTILLQDCWSTVWVPKGIWWRIHFYAPAGYWSPTVQAVALVLLIGLPRQECTFVSLTLNMFGHIFKKLSLPLREQMKHVTQQHWCLRYHAQSCCRIP